ncbi:MAG TPA: hypothetical protein VF783_23495 [Terriglobales bacterium]
MELAIAVIVYTILAAIGFRRRDRTVHSREVSLCLTCTNAVVTHGTRGQEWIACNFGGAMRAVKFTVCSCTGYRATSVSEKLVTIEGFAREKRGVYQEVAIS